MASRYRFLGVTLKVWGVVLVALVVLTVAMDRYPPLLDWFAGQGDPAVQHWDDRAVGWLSRTASRVFSSQGGEALLQLFLAPGHFVVNGLWTKVLRQDTNPFHHHPALDALFVLMLFGVPVVFWWVVGATAWSRSWFYLGRWNPFREGDLVAMGLLRTPRESRRWVLMGIVKARDTWEMARKFGRTSTGGWASFLEVLSNRFLSGDVFLGRPRLPLGGGMLRPIGVPTEKHMVTIAGTGSGKSTAGLIPNLCIHPGSLLCIDPKGELATVTARRRGPGGRGVSGMGQDVHVLDPFGTVQGWQSASYNVFAELANIAASDPDNAVSYANTITAALYVETSVNESFWDTAAQNFLVALILYVFSCEPEEKRNLVHLRHLVMTGGDALIARMEKAGGPYADRIARAAAGVRNMPDNTRGSMEATLQTNTAFLELPQFERISQRSDFLISDLKNRRMSVYLCLPINELRGKSGRWLRMFVLLLIDIMMRSTKKPDPPILLAIDEFPNLGHLEGIEAVAPVLRSYGVRFWAIAQDIEQLEKVYPGVWGGFLGGAEAVQFMGITHRPTVEYLVHELGRHVVRKRVRSRGQTHWEQEERNLLDANQVPRLLAPDRKNQIILRGSRKPMLLKTAPYFWYLPARFYDQDPRYRELFRHRIWRGWLSRKPQPLGPRFLAPPPASASSAAPVFLRNTAADETPAKPKRNSLVEDMFIAGKPLTSGAKTDATPPPHQTKDGLPPGFSELLEQSRRQADVPRPGTAVPVDDVLKELHGMIGLDAVKEEVQKLVDLMNLHARRRQHGLPDISLSHHLVFTGNPGTGKTTVARLIGRLYKQFGILTSGHVVEVDRGGLVANYMGQTPGKVMEAVNKALDGILFIDEAYSLTPKDGKDQYGEEAVATLLKAMEDHRERLVVVVAGYPEDMKRFIASNPGLQSRFRTTIHFPDYKVEDLVSIFDTMCASAGCRLSLAARKAVSFTFSVMKDGSGTAFGNGRAVRNLFEDCVSRQARRLAAKGDVSRTDVTMIEAEDVPEVPIRRAVAPPSMPEPVEPVHAAVPNVAPTAPVARAPVAAATPPAPLTTQPTRPVRAPKRITQQPETPPGVSDDKVQEILSWTDQITEAPKRKRGRPRKDAAES